MIIRSMDSDDVASVALIEKASFSQPWSVEGFKSALEMEGNILLVAQEDDRIIGYVCTYVSFDEGELTNIAVAQSARESGVAVALLKELFDRAAQAGVGRIVLEARVSNEPAISLYKKMGFVELGVRKNFYEQPVEDALIMSYSGEGL